MIVGNLSFRDILEFGMGAAKTRKTWACLKKAYYYSPKNVPIMTREQLTELIDFAKELKLEKESLQEVLYQKDFADQYSVDKYVYQLVVGL